MLERPTMLRTALAFLGGMVAALIAGGTLTLAIAGAVLLIGGPLR
jgi:hypothetical protein